MCVLAGVLPGLLPSPHRHSPLQLANRWHLVSLVWSSLQPETQAGHVPAPLTREQGGARAAVTFARSAHYRPWPHTLFLILTRW